MPLGLRHIADAQAFITGHPVKHHAQWLTIGSDPPLNFYRFACVGVKYIVDKIFIRKCLC